MSVPVAVVDLDGVVFKSPASETIKDARYWAKYWCRPGDQEPNLEVVRLVRALNREFAIYFLTARPLAYTLPTLEALARCGFYPNSWEPQPFELQLGESYIRFWDITSSEAAAINWSSSEWKAGVVRGLLQREIAVQFAIEDFKPNVEAIRRVVPVLSYEQLR